MLLERRRRVHEAIITAAVVVPCRLRLLELGRGRLLGLGQQLTEKI
jgi:hypothetical protein